MTVEDDGSFGNRPNNKIIKTMYANVLNLNNSELVQAYETNASIIVSFRVTNTKFTKELPFKTKDYKIDWKGNIYDIITAVPTKDMNYIDVKGKAVL